MSYIDDGEERMTPLRTAAMLTLWLPVSGWLGLVAASAIAMRTGECTWEQAFTVTWVTACLLVPFMLVSRILFLIEERQTTKAADGREEGSAG